MFGLLAYPSEQFGGNSEMQRVHESIEAHAVNAVNMLLITQCPAVTAHAEEYLTHIIGIYGTVRQDSLRQRIVEGVTTMLDF